MIALVGVALLVTACSSGSAGTGTSVTSTPTTTGPGTASARTACDSISPAQVKAATGTAVGPPHVTVHGLVATCSYPAPDAGQTVAIQYASGADPTQFNADETQVADKYGPVTTVTGLGDRACYSTTPAGARTATTVVTLTGSLQFIVTSTASLAQMEDLAQVVLYSVQSARSATTSTPTTG